MAFEEMTQRNLGAKKPYSAPALVCYGDFSTLTLTGGTSNKNDGPGTSSKVGA
jgi:hypothetical protein